MKSLSNITRGDNACPLDVNGLTFTLNQKLTNVNEQ